jgi:hypothetical protein
MCFLLYLGQNQLQSQEIERLLLSDAAQSVLEMGYQPRLIKKSIEEILKQNGMMFFYYKKSNTNKLFNMNLIFEPKNNLLFHDTSYLVRVEVKFNGHMFSFVNDIGKGISSRLYYVTW